MTFYEQELQKIIGERYPDATYVGRTCYVRLGDMNRAKIEFVTAIQADRYNALQMTILNRCEGKVDVLRLQFADLLGTKKTSNPYFSDGMKPYIWDDYRSQQDQRLLRISPVGVQGGLSEGNRRRKVRAVFGTVRCLYAQRDV